MLTAIRKLRLGILMAALAGAVMLASAGPAMAVKFVASDSVTWKGSVSATGEIVVSTCRVKSDTELTAFPCQLRVQVGVGPTGAFEVASVWTSSDGLGAFSALGIALVKVKPPLETYAAAGPCIEAEESDLPGTTGPVEYPCVVSVKLTFNTVKHTVSGAYSVKEESTQP